MRNPSTQKGFVNKNLNIAFITGSLQPGGAERQLGYILRALSDKGYNVCLFYTDQSEEFLNSLKLKKISLMNYGEYHSFSNRLSFVKREISTQHIDLIQSQVFHANIYSSIIGRMLGITSIGAIRNNLFNEIKPLGFIGLACLYFPQYLIANSDIGYARAKALGRKPRKVFKLNNAIDTTEFKPPTSKTRNNKLEILLIGRLVKQKRIDRAIEIAKILKDDGIMFNMSIYGQGPEKERLENYAESLGLLNNQVHFLGISADPSTLYQSSDVLLSTSDFEGTPNVVLEAMACGIPVIASNVDGNSGLIINKETGFLFEKRNLHRVSEILQMLMNSPAEIERITKNSVCYINENHSIDNLSTQLSYIYSEITKTK